MKEKILYAAAILLGGGLLLAGSSAILSEMLGTGDILRILVMGSHYRKSGNVTVTQNGRQRQTVAVYKAEHKPFLLLGPCRLSDDPDEPEDFFFVNQSRVVITATDKGGGDRLLTGSHLFVLDDLTGDNRFRSSVSDCTANVPDGIIYDREKRYYHYSFSFAGKTRHVAFSLPEKLLTGDMIKAQNNLVF